MIRYFIATFILTMSMLFALSKIAGAYTPPPNPADDDDWDGIQSLGDNCPNLYNPLQLDSDNDSFGNRCDFDYDNDGNIDTEDFQMLKDAYGIVGATVDQTNEVFDSNEDGHIGWSDITNFMAGCGNQYPGISSPAYIEDDDEHSYCLTITRDTMAMPMPEPSGALFFGAALLMLMRRMK